MINFPTPFLSVKEGWLCLYLSNKSFELLDDMTVAKMGVASLIL